VLVIVCLDYLSAYFSVFTHFTLHSRFSICISTTSRASFS